MNLLDERKISVVKATKEEYPSSIPFSPSVKYPEYMFDDLHPLNEYNYTYEAVRNAFIYLGLDSSRINTPEWNPLGEIIKPDEVVLIKPNFVMDRHNQNGELFSLITHPSIIRAVCDYVIIALKGRGKIIIADAPQANADFNKLLENTHLLEIKNYYCLKSTVDIDILDLRQLVVDSFCDSSTRKLQEGDPNGYCIIDLGNKSKFTNLKGIEKIYGADFDRNEVFTHHNGTVNEYCISKTVLTADVIINIPKMKTHRKAGVTLAMKNMVGINGNKNYLPHYRIGAPDEGGDEFETLNTEQKMITHINRFLKDNLLTRKNIYADKLYKRASQVYQFFKSAKIMQDNKDMIDGGNWYGNDTIWRMIDDLNKIVIYSDVNGFIRTVPQRKMLTIIDGIWAGEGEGPLTPELRKEGTIICGFNPLLVDLVTVKLMGFDYRKIAKLNYMVEEEFGTNSFLNLNDVIMLFSNCVEFKNYNDLHSSTSFKPAKGWNNLKSNS